MRETGGRDASGAVAPSPMWWCLKERSTPTGVQGGGPVVVPDIDPAAPGTPPFRDF